jgi:hypothetical protein
LNKISGNPVPTDKLIHRLRLMAGAGGMLTRDRLKTISEAADRLEDYDERIAIMLEGHYIIPGGDANEEY